MTDVRIVVGAQWGDEGKGKWIDVLAKDADVVVRYQGGNNAGHTIYVDGEKVVLHQLPSGIFHKDKRCALAAGVVVNPAQLVTEMETARGRGSAISPERLWLSGRAHVITPWHIHLDGEQESQRANPIGTTKRGIGPTYAAKASRTGLRLCQYIEADARNRWLDTMRRDPAFQAHETTHQEDWQIFTAAAEALAEFVCDAESKIRRACRGGERVLLEGAQGTLLDLDHGTYPFVTSSNTGAGGACQSIGLAPKWVNEVVGVAKAYTTRVGEGPFPTELHDDTGALIAKRGHEFGATTGRPRRCGWLDGVALRHSVDMNGLDAIILNKMDILGGLPEVKIATAYKHPRLGEIHKLPWDAAILEDCEPVYQSFPGWSDDAPTRGKIADLPEAARAFVAAVEEIGHTKVKLVGMGPGPEDGLT